GALGAALVAGNGLIYAASQERDGVVYALEPAHGRVRWHKQVGYAAAAPLLLGDTLVLPLEQGALLALRASGDEAGERLWLARLPASPATSPVAWGELLVVAARNDSVYALRRRDGGMAARAAVGGFASASPALAGDTLYLPLETGGILTLRLPRLERLFLAKLPGTGPTSATPSASAGGETTSGSAPPLSAGAGPAIPPGAAVLAAPVVASDGSVYFLDAGARLGRIAPGTATASLLADLGGAARAALTLTRDGLLVGKLDGTLALVRFDGRTSWSTTLDGAIAAPAAVVDGVAYVPLLRGRIVKLR
ncbi:MAG TPA: PQQ-binding-like beta-propeller repeat protein, partial [Longimicrobiales bacterium]